MSGFSNSDKICEENFLKLIAIIENLDISSCSGKLLYSSQSTLIAGDFYIIGFNPGGGPTVEDQKILAHLRSTPIRQWSEYTCASWKFNGVTREPGKHDKQKRINALTAKINIKLEETLCTNAVFLRDATVKKTKGNAEYTKFVRECAIVHGFLMGVVQPKTVICFGEDAKKLFCKMQMMPEFEVHNIDPSLRRNAQIVKIPHFSARWKESKFIERSLEDLERASICLDRGASK